MKRVLGWILIVLAVAFVAIQFRTVARTNPPATAELAIPADLAPVLERACFDCHSNRTRWPWYSRVAPASWWIVRHVEEGREHLNFSEWPEDDPYKVRHQLHEIEEVLEEGEMPPRSYTWIHRGADLTPEEAGRIIAWAAAERAAVPDRGEGNGGGEPDDGNEGRDR